MNDDQSNLFELDSDEAADEAIAAVEEHADPEWLDRALDALRFVASAKVTFTADDVWAEMQMRHADDGVPYEPRALGAVMRKAARRGWIEPTRDYRKSRRSSRHGAPMRVWRETQAHARQTQ